MTFTPVLTIPSASDKYFIRKAYGGYSPCIEGKPARFKGSALANCVGLCFGLAMWREQNLKTDIGVPPSRLKRGMNNPASAQYWVQYANGRKVTKTPVLGGIIVYRSIKTKNLGHVMSIEQIDEKNKKVIAVASGYGNKGYNFKKVTLPYNLAYRGWKLLGVIHLRIPADTPTPAPDKDALKVGDKVKIIGTGNANEQGTGRTAYGSKLGARYIMAINLSAKYPYRVGVNGRTTGYYTNDSLKKI